MTNGSIDHLSSTAQSLVHALEHAAQVSCTIRGYGYAQVSEFAVGGLGPNPPEDPDELAEYEPSDVRLAIAELADNGIEVRFSDGVALSDHGRMLVLIGKNGGPVKMSVPRNQQRQGG